jgi:hypothetical protein
MVRQQSGQPSDWASVAVLTWGIRGSDDEALKDTLRNAVRQVDGALADADELVKNDVLISGLRALP